MKLRVNNNTNVLRKCLILGKTMSLTGILIAQSTDALLDKLSRKGGNYPRRSHPTAKGTIKKIHGNKK